MMSNIAKFVKDHFNGLLVFGDIHGDYESFEMAADFAQENDLFFMSLGDLVDRGPQPYEVVQSMHRMMGERRAGFTIGNHDHKFHRYANGANVIFSQDGKQTLISVGPDRTADFLKMYADINDHIFFSDFFHTFDDFSLVHAASHPCIWENPAVIGKTEKYMFIVGETNGEKMDDGYPVRLYNWIDKIPKGKTVIVGHDKMPIHGINITEPMIVPNKTGGTAIFLDTGCGKGGFLSGAVMIPGKNGFMIDKFVEFKQKVDIHIVK